MNLLEMHKKVKEIYKAREYDYYHIGIRFEDKEREIGEVCEYSRHNGDREDERDFPEYGTPEYEELETLDGTSAWDLAALTDTYLPGYGRINDADPEKECSRYFNARHCYVIASDQAGRHDDPDVNEILIKDAVVIAQLL